MGTYAYCVVPAGHLPQSGSKGVADATVESVDVGNIGLWVSRMPRPDGSVEQIKAHNRIVESAVTNEVTPVPLRFGQWVEDEAALIASAAEQAASYEEKLREFAGCLEFGVRVLDPGMPAGARDVHPAKGVSGLQYMQALRESSRLATQRQSEAEQVRSRIQAALRDLVRAEREEEARTPHALLTLSHLVARAHFDEYRERARQLREIFPALRWLLSGPWPPYSFAV